MTKSPVDPGKHPQLYNRLGGLPGNLNSKVSLGSQGEDMVHTHVHRMESTRNFYFNAFKAFLASEQKPLSCARLVTANSADL